MEFTSTAWTKPQKCDNSSPSCVEVKRDKASGDFLVRDSKQIDGPVLSFSPDEWSAFGASIKDGQFAAA